jgi:hypothetical protein
VIEWMRPEQIPKCPCGDLCDRETASGEWYHSKCQPDRAKRNAETTKRVLVILEAWRQNCERRH